MISCTQEGVTHTSGCEPLLEFDNLPSISVVFSYRKEFLAGKMVIQNGDSILRFLCRDSFLINEVQGEMESG